MLVRAERSHRTRPTTGRRPRPRTFLRVELLESRHVPATVTVNAGAIVTARPAPLGADFLGVNVAQYTHGLNAGDGTLAATAGRVQAAGLGLFRLAADAENENTHFNQEPPVN